jgi:hypothetical protein
MPCSLVAAGFPEVNTKVERVNPTAARAQLTTTFLGKATKQKAR